MELQIQFKNMWNSFAIGTFKNVDNSFHVEYNHIMSTNMQIDTDTKRITNAITKFQTDSSYIESLVNDSWKLVIDFNAMSFVHLLHDDDKEMLIRQLAADIGFDKAFSIIQDQEEYQSKEQENEY